MPITFPCPACKSNLTAPDAAAGRTAKCPKCGNVNAVPGIAPAPTAKKSATPPASPRPRQSQVATPPTSNLIPSPTLRYRTVSFLKVGQSIALFLGCWFLLFFGAFYNTTVPGGLYGGSIHNLGLMQNRTTGMIAGGALLLFGAVLTLKKDDGKSGQLRNGCAVVLVAFIVFFTVVGCILMNIQFKE